MNQFTYSENNRASYSPEDNKLRLYVGRIPRDEYLKLRDQGWTSTPKQSCDFVATWTPERRDTALEYAGIIEDEDMGPAERAADRAERFGEYRDKRTDEATGHADRYDSGPMAHGYQNQARAERAAARHDRIGSRAVDAWSKAEYWQRRTAGVIDHALYKSTPGVRMGRIKELESLLRKKEAVYGEALKWFKVAETLKDITDPDDQTLLVVKFFGRITSYREYPHPDSPLEVHSIYTHLTSERRRKITGREALEMYFSDHGSPDIENNDWANHYKLRLAYENQMLAAQGGRLEQFEVLPGGKLGGKLILKVSKSSATGRPTSVDVLGPRVSGGYRTGNFPGTEWAAYYFTLERLDPGAYTPPTPESLAELAEVKAKIKAAAPKAEACPLINPTDEDAERLQAIWNERTRAEIEARKARDKYCCSEFKPQSVCRCTQSVYSSASNGSYGRAETIELAGGGSEMRQYNGCYEGDRKAALAAQGPAVCQVRKTSGENYQADRVIVLTDKLQKVFPTAVWEKCEPKAQADAETKTCDSCERTTPIKSWEIS